MALPPPPTNLNPHDGAKLAQSVPQVTISWNYSPHAADYTLTVDDLTDPDQRYTVLDCPDEDHYFYREHIARNSYSVPVISGHVYRWTVQACNAAGCSAPVGGIFSIGNFAADSALAISQSVPRTLQPGQQVQVSVGMQNTGATTWTKDQNYRLGSQFPQDNTAWGTNRVDLPAGVQVRPGQTYVFNFTIHAPQTPGLYVFQWRMLVEGVHWFGQKSNDVPVVVGAPLKLSRDAANGRILNRGNPITFRGGHYYLFQEQGMGDRAVVTQGTSNPIAACYHNLNEMPCSQRNLTNAAVQTWGGQPWTDLFSSLRANNINLLRIFGTDGTALLNGRFRDLYPFKKVHRPEGSDGRPGEWRWQVFQALACDQWETAYFDRLKAFAAAALNSNVAIQISLFNDYDLADNTGDTYAAWAGSPWNPAICDLPPSYPNWADNHLVRGGNASERKDNFLFGASAGLRNLQQALARQIVKSLYGYDNVIFEIYNEPHRGSQQQVAQFNSMVVDWIKQEFQPDWRPLISANAFRLDADTSEMSWWSDHRTQYPHYEDVDAISYHGVAGYVASINKICDQTLNPAPTEPVIDPQHIQQRFNVHKSKNSDKAMICSTDGASVSLLTHHNADSSVEMKIVDGQIYTNINRGSVPANAVLYADLQDLAYWTLTTPNQLPGQVHFQNHSAFQKAFEQIRAALDSPIVC